MTVELNDNDPSSDDDGIGSGKSNGTTGGRCATEGGLIGPMTTTMTPLDGNDGYSGNQSIPDAANTANYRNRFMEDTATGIGREEEGTTSSSSRTPRDSNDDTEQTRKKLHNGFISDELRGFVIDKLNSEYVVPNPVTGELELRRGAYCQVGQLIGKSHGTVKNIWVNREADCVNLREQRRHRKDTTAAEKDTMVYDLLLGATKDEQTGNITVKKGSFAEMAAKFNVTESTVRRIFKVAEHEHKSGRGFKYPHDRRINSGSGKKRIMTIDQFKGAILTVPRGQRTIPNMARAIKASESTVAAYLNEAPHLNMLVDCALGSRPRKPKDKEIYREAILSLPMGGRKCMAVANVLGVSDSAVRDFVRLDGNEDLLGLIDSKRGLTGVGERHRRISTEYIDGIKKVNGRGQGRPKPIGDVQTNDSGALSKALGDEAPPAISAKGSSKSTTATGTSPSSTKERQKATLAHSIDTTTPIRATTKKPVSKRLAVALKKTGPKKRSKTAKLPRRASRKVIPTTGATVSTTGVPTTKAPLPSIIAAVSKVVERSANSDITIVQKDKVVSEMLTRQKKLQEKLAEIQAELAKINAAVYKSKDVTNFQLGH